MTLVDFGKSVRRLRADADACNIPMVLSGEVGPVDPPTKEPAGRR